MLTNDDKYENTINKTEKFANYLNDICNDDITFDYTNYDKMLTELKEIKIKYKPDSPISLYIDYLFDFIKNYKINSKIRKIKLQKIMNYNDTKNIN